MPVVPTFASALNTGTKFLMGTDIYSVVGKQLNMVYAENSRDGSIIQLHNEDCVIPLYSL